MGRHHPFWLAAIATLALLLGAFGSAFADDASDTKVKAKAKKSRAPVDLLLREGPGPEPRKPGVVPKAPPGLPLYGPTLDPKAEDEAKRFTLRPTSPGSCVYEHKSFRARIVRDGKVKFEPRRDPQISDEEQKALHESANNRAHIAGDGSTVGSPVGPGVVVGSFGQSKDAYRKLKQAFLSDTFEERLKMADWTRRERAQAALGQLREFLDWLMTDPRRSICEKKQDLLQLWDEIDDSLPVAAEARATIEGFVRRRLPASSPDAYRAEELARFNRGKARRFDPYG